jgi:hypothetical protein
MSGNNLPQLPPDRKLQGASNIMAWLTAITLLLVTAGLESYLQQAEYGVAPSDAPLSRNHIRAKAVVALSICKSTGKNALRGKVHSA